jgi:hypothetical protein
MVIAHASPREVGDAKQRRQYPVLIHEVCGASDCFETRASLVEARAPYARRRSSNEITAPNSITYLARDGSTKTAHKLTNPVAVQTDHQRSSNQIKAPNPITCLARNGPTKTADKLDNPAHV